MKLFLDFLHFLTVAGSSFIIFMIGMMYAYFPINDKETSTAHRALWFVITTIALFFFWKVAA